MSNGGSWSYLTEHLQFMLGILIEHARRGETLTYEELEAVMTERWGSCSPHWRLGQHLGRISHWEHNHGRPCISAIVVNRDGSVGPGFWKMTEGEMHIPVLDRDVYLVNMQLSVFRFWQAEPARV